MATNQALLKSARLFHLYSGVFLTPALLFFAFTGGIQSFSLHETTRGSSYKPPAILVQLGQLHKKQTLVVPVRKGPPGEANAGRPGTASAPATTLGATPDALSGERRERRADRGAAGADSGPKSAEVKGPEAKSAETKSPTSSANPSQPQLSPAPPAKVHNLIPMKIFFVIVSFGLFFSTLTGLYMSYKYARRKSTITLTLVAGIVVPLLLLLF